MSAPAPIINLKQIKTNLCNHSLLWIIPTVVCTALGLSYAAVKSNKWKATQVTGIRSIGLDSALYSPGAFASVEALKTAQEGVVNAAHNPKVVEAALRDIGPLNGNDPSYPSKAEVEASIGKIIVAPPKGTEFGKSDLIYISTEARTPERAEAFTTALVKHLERKLQEIRAETAKSRIAEFIQMKAVAEEKLNEETTKLKKLEREVGPDIGELRALTDAKAFGNTNLDTIKERIRTIRQKLDENQQLLQLLVGALNETDRLARVPTELFDKKPNLKKMKENLIEAQIKVANLSSKTKNHPEVQAAILVEEKIRQQLGAELDELITGLKSDLVINNNEIVKLQNDRQQVEDKMDRLGSLRAIYMNLDSAVKSASENLSKETKKLSDAEASLAAAYNTSELIKQDLPDAGTSPIGPSGLMIVIGAFGGGLFFGLSLVFITVPIGQAWGRRWSDYMGAGRRSSDRQSQQQSDRADSARRSSDLAIQNRRASNEALPDRRGGAALPAPDRRPKEATQNVTILSTDIPMPPSVTQVGSSLEKS